MAVTVPKEDKVYTTIYDTFRGVDFTNDPSNVWKHRSPSGKNMLPDLDGRPYKRKGWDIAITAEQFREAADVENVEVIPDKTYYFELNGYDFLLIFNNLGIFSYTANPVAESAGTMPYLLTHLNKYIDINNQQQDFPPQIDGVDVPIDSGRAFFFEGGGTAGFYLFVGLKLFRFDGAYFREVEPHIPLTLIGCAPNGAGEPLEQINMLTDKRTVSYSCDGSSKSFTVPGGFSGTPKVEVRNATTGNWQTATGYTATNGKIDFSTAPAVVVEGEDNLRVTYSPDGIGSTAEEKTNTVKDKIVTVTRKITQVQGKWTATGTPGAWSTVKSTYYPARATFATPNIKVNAQTKAKDITFQGVNTSGNWATLNSKYYSAAWGAYNNSVVVTPTAALFNSPLPRVNTTASQSPKYSTGKWVKTNTTRKVNGKTQVLYQRNRIISEVHQYRFRVTYTSYQYKKSATRVNESTTAFTQCSRALVFGSGIINQVFMSTTPYSDYNTRIWYSYATDPTYFPDTNYLEVGATDTPIMGMMKVGEYLGVIKKGTSFDTSIYLAYPTSFENDTTYAVKQNINGIGAISNGAFNTLNEEPLFLSKVGVMGIEVSAEDTDRQLRNRSYFVNKRLQSEEDLSQAVSFVYDGMYYLAVNNRCYVLDGSQKNSWANTKTNLQYECYYLENIPTQCFARFQDQLWFSDYRGNMCRFRDDNDAYPYRDAYSVEEAVESSDAPIPEEYTDEYGVTRVRYKFALAAFSEVPEVGDIVRYGLGDYTVTDVGETILAQEGVPIDAVWSTIADDDGAVHYFKNLQKKGCVVSLLPSSDSGVKVYIKADSKDPYYAGETDAKDFDLPYEFYSKKKIKKYKRLQFICENNTLDDSFGVDQIIKSYTMGNYSKNKR